LRPQRDGDAGCAPSPVEGLRRHRRVADATERPAKQENAVTNALAVPASAERVAPPGHNFGDAGVGYIFVSPDCIEGRFRWQCG